MRLDPRLFGLPINQKVQLLVRHEQDKQLSTEEIKDLLLNRMVDIMILDNKIKELLRGHYQANRDQETDSQKRV